MLLGFNGATTMKATLPEDIAAASEAGFKALEIWAAKMDTYLVNHSLDDLNALFAEHRIYPASINSIEFITFRSADDYALIKARCHELCARADALGCDTIVVVPSPTPEGGASWREIKAESVRVLHDLADIAAPYGVQLAYEFLGFGWCSVRTLAQCWEIVQAVNRPNVGLVIDTCHFYAGGSELPSIEAVDPERLLIFHINDVEARPLETIEDAHRLLPGEGVIPLDAILSRLQKIGFDGLCSIELFRPEYWERDPVELATAARVATMKVLEPYFRLE
jgi:2-keto-myo-inositol isomerase